MKDLDSEFRLSVSKTKCFSHCKKQYEFSYILKLPKKDKDYHIFGKFCHKVLEDFHLALMENPNEIYHTLMTSCFKKAKKEFKIGMTSEMIDQCFKILSEYLEIVSIKKANNTLPIVLGCEKTFKVDIGENVILNGMIDKVEIDSDGIINVIDYKTSKDSKYLKNDWLQLLTYAYVMYNEDPTITKVKGSYVMLKHNFEYITKEFDLAEILTIKEKYLSYARQMRNEKKFETNTGPLCEYCDFSEEHCDEGREFVEMIKAKRDGKKVFSGEIDW